MYPAAQGGHRGGIGHVGRLADHIQAFGGQGGDRRSQGRGIPRHHHHLAVGLAELPADLQAQAPASAGHDRGFFG
ncbi:hypothetical protein SDC9_190407 [bioreactor metagenome]|uniref:Uncharacterized protein n=1 Tax=bioreactor metagenome TaxID=1076179 RepID=A0A645HXD0_9ZZZZ